MLVVSSGLTGTHSRLKEYLREEGHLSPGAVHMVGDLLNDQSLMHIALTEVMYVNADVNDNNRWVTTNGRNQELRELKPPPGRT